ncbi:hypothetical protein GWK47_046622 [Chionoecetes opilio]|uniref:Uncharacterized protein n=1 Tax=Chionoecetes opilio TaxID=41210 RepID=A0A8J5CTJ9_CHIOP|nr:hypothetical protein GWK47_046622 [Chionoecetes opilio]
MHGEDIMNDSSADGNFSETIDSEDEPVSPSNRYTGGYMSTDSEDTGNFDLQRTLRHYRQGRGRGRSSSECSCDSCDAHMDDSFFCSEEGPPGGENTVPRRAFIWLEHVRGNWGFLFLGSLVLSAVITAAALAFRETGLGPQVGSHVLHWTVPVVTVTAGIIVAWAVARHLLRKRGYSKGDHVMERWNLIQDAQGKELVYTVRGAIYAPTYQEPTSRRRRRLFPVTNAGTSGLTPTLFDSDLGATAVPHPSVPATHQLLLYSQPLINFSFIAGHFINFSFIASHFINFLLIASHFINFSFIASHFITSPL